jgi:hypothetical protein
MTKRFNGILPCCPFLLLAGCFNYVLPGLPEDDSTLSENVENIEMDFVESDLDGEGHDIEPIETLNDPDGGEAGEGAGDDMEDVVDMTGDEGGPPTLTCPGAGTLEELVICIAGQMPDQDSEGFVVPAEAVQGDWSGVVAQMLGGQCDDIALPSSLGPVYSIGTFTDGDNHRGYCVLMEILDEDSNGKVDRGWGTFITNPAPSREINVQIAHPVFDTGTEVEGIGIFKGIDGRSYLMAGANREANSSPSACQAGYTDSDVAHNVANMFQPAAVQLKSFYDTLGRSFTVFQFHGMGSTTCPGVDVYLTHGLSSRPGMGDRLFNLQSNLLAHNPTWVVCMPGDTPPCTLNGTTNVQGRYFNGVEAGSVCITSASSSTGIFYYTEQSLACRNAVDWIDAVIDTWP